MRILEVQTSLVLKTILKTKKFEEKIAQNDPYKKGQLCKK